EELAQHIGNDLSKQFDEWGMVIKSFQITNVNFPATITQAMSEVVASEQLRKAAENRGEASKIQAIKEADAERERKRLQAEGVAIERQAIANGIKASIEVVKLAAQQDAREVLAVLTLTQYMDMLKSVGSTQNSKIIFMDSSPGKTSQLMAQLMAAMNAPGSNG